MRLLVTGGAGYIGAHLVRALQLEGHAPVVLDDLSTGAPKRLADDVPLLEGSVLDTSFVAEGLLRYDIDVVVHLAAKKAVEESMAEPLMYYDENVTGMQSLLAAMAQAGTRKILLSSSAAVYGIPSVGAVTEMSPTAPESPYGWSKLMSEQIMKDVAAAEGYNWAALRYFNVGGAQSPELGDRGAKNLIPQVFRAVTAGVSPQIFGTAHPTHDGTCVRDYIHVDDVASAHVAVLKQMHDTEVQAIYNIGTGHGSSVLEVMEATRRITGIDFNWDELPARAGDPPVVIADTNKIESELGWQSTRDLDDIIGSAWTAWSSVSGPS